VPVLENLIIRYLACQKMPILAESEVAAPPLQKPTIKPHCTSSQRTSLRTTFRAVKIASNDTVANYTYATEYRYSQNCHFARHEGILFSGGRRCIAPVILKPGY